MVEYRSYTPVVAGSNPAPPIISFSLFSPGFQSFFLISIFSLSHLDLPPLNVQPLK